MASLQRENESQGVEEVEKKAVVEDKDQAEGNSEEKAEVAAGPAKAEVEKKSEGKAPEEA